MDFARLGMRELRDVALQGWLRGAGGKLREGACASLGGRNM